MSVYVVCMVSVSAVGVVLAMCVYVVMVLSMVCVGVWLEFL